MDYETDTYVDLLGIGSITQLNDLEHDTAHKIPLGFQPPEDTMTPYRDRLNKGEYAPKKAPKPKPNTEATTKAAKSDTDKSDE